MRFTVSPNRTFNNTATVDYAPTLVWTDKPAYLRGIQRYKLRKYPSNGHSK